MEKLIPKKQHKGKSAKYKNIERISRKAFFLCVSLIFIILITVVAIAFYLENAEEIEEYLITVSAI